MSTIEQELIEKINRLDVEKQRRVLEFVRGLEEPQPTIKYTVHELMKLPLRERNLIVAQALERSANDETELFDAYGDADFDDK